MENKYVVKELGKIFIIYLNEFIFIIQFFTDIFNNCIVF